MGSTDTEWEMLPWQCWFFFLFKIFFFFFLRNINREKSVPSNFQPSRLSYHDVFVKNCHNKIRQYTCKLLQNQNINQFTTSCNLFTLHIVFADFVIQCSFLASRNNFQNQKFLLKVSRFWKNCNLSIRWVREDKSGAFLEGKMGILRKKVLQS